MNAPEPADKREEFLRNCLANLDDKMKSWNISTFGRDAQETRELGEMVERLRDLSTIGKGIIVDMGDGGSFDNFCNSSSYRNKLIITWYEHERRFGDSNGHHLVLIPDYMLTMHDPQDSRANLIYISNKKMNVESEWARGDAIGRSKEAAVYQLKNEREGVLLHSKGSYFRAPAVAHKLLKFLSYCDSESAQGNLLNLFK